MADYMSLIERLEKATEDRELDAAVYEARVGEVWNDFLSGPWAADGKSRVPFYTSSIDAALSLVPEGAEYSITTLYGLAMVEVPLNFTDVDPQSATRKDGNVPLAICIAALKAHSLIGKKEG